MVTITMVTMTMVTMTMVTITMITTISMEMCDAPVVEVREAHRITKNGEYC